MTNTPHTGQGQIIDAENLESKDGVNWYPAEEYPYYPNILERIQCFIGWHKWNDATCIKCKLSL